MAEYSSYISWNLSGDYGTDKHIDYTPAPWYNIPAYSIINSVKVQLNNAYQDIKLGSTKGSWYVKMPSDGNEVYSGDNKVTKTAQTLVSDDIKSYFQSGTEKTGYLDNSYSAMRIGFSSIITRPWYVSGANLIYDYTPSQYTLRVEVEGDGAITGGGTWVVPLYSEKKYLEANPNRGWKFIKWVDSDGNEYTFQNLTIVINTPYDYSSNGNDQILISATNTEKTYTAYFERIPYTIKYNITGTGYLPYTSVTHGGTMESQIATVASDVTLSLNAYKQYYTVTLDPNCEDLDKKYLYSFSEFKGWEDRSSITADSGETFSYTEFDAPYYANAYPDLYNSFGYNKLSLVNHWVNNGRSEGRQCVGDERGLYPDGAVVNSIADSGDTAYLYASWGDLQPVNLPSYIMRNQYIFEGWYTSPTGGKKVEGDYLPCSNVTLYAHWRNGYWSLCELLNGTRKPLRIFIDEQEVKKIFINKKKVYASFAATQGSVADIKMVKVYKEKLIGGGYYSYNTFKIPLNNFYEKPEKVDLTINEESYWYPNSINVTSENIEIPYQDDDSSKGDGRANLIVMYDGQKHETIFDILTTESLIEAAFVQCTAFAGEKYSFSIFVYQGSYPSSDYPFNAYEADVDYFSTRIVERVDCYEIYFDVTFNESEYSLNYKDDFGNKWYLPDTYIAEEDDKWTLGYERFPCTYSFAITDSINVRYYGRCRFTSENTLFTSTFSLVKIRIKALEDTLVTVAYTQTSHESGNYSLFSNLDEKLNSDILEDEEYKNKIPYKYSSTSKYTQTGTITYTVPSGEHFFYVKFVKSANINYEDDCLKFDFPRG